MPQRVAGENIAGIPHRFIHATLRRRAADVRKLVYQDRWPDVAHPNRLGTPQRGGSCLPAFPAVQTLPDSPLCRQRLPTGLKNAAGPVLSTSGTQPAIYTSEIYTSEIYTSEIYTSEIACRQNRRQTYEMLNRAIDDGPCTVLINRAARRMKTKNKIKVFPPFSGRRPYP